MAVTVDHSHANNITISTNTNTISIVGPDNQNVVLTEDTLNTVNVLEVGAQGPRGLEAYDTNTDLIARKISASGDISSSGIITAEHFDSSHDIVAAGQISASGEIYGAGYYIGNSNISSTLGLGKAARFNQGTSVAGNDYSGSNIAAYGNFAIIIDTGNTYAEERFEIKKNSPFLALATTIYSLDGAGNITGSGNISASGEIEGRYRRPIQTISSNGALTLAAKGAYLRCGSHVVTMSLNSAVPFPVGTEIDLIQTSATGHLMVTASDDEAVTINTRHELFSASGQFSAISLKKVGTDEWDMIGDLTK